MNSFESIVEIEMLCRLYNERMNTNYSKKYYEYDVQKNNYNDKFGYKIVESGRKIKKLIRKK